LIGIAGPAPAQTYPSRTITVVVPFPPAGGVDSLARIVAEKLSIALKATAVVEDRAAGGGIVGTRTVANAGADRDTLMLAHRGARSPPRRPGSCRASPSMRATIGARTSRRSG